MKLKVILSVVLGLSMVILPTIGSAKSLAINNSTKKPFTVVVNHQCSAQFGVINTNNGKTVGEEDLIKLCGTNSSDCRASIFKSSNCTGEEIANFTFDPKTGLKQANNSFGSAKHYSITLSYALNEVVLTQSV